MKKSLFLMHLLSAPTNFYGMRNDEIGSEKSISLQRTRTISSEDKKWLSKTFKEGMSFGPLFILEKLKKKCLFDNSNKMYHLKIAVKWINHAKEKEIEEWYWYDHSTIDRLVHNELITFNDEKEKDIFCFTLSSCLPDEKVKYISNLSPETYNKFMYHQRPIFDNYTVRGIKLAVAREKEGPYKEKNHPNWTDDIKTLFGPIMYKVSDDDDGIKNVVRYSYKEMDDIFLNIKTVFTCFHILRKSRTNKINRLFMPKVLIKKIINDDILLFPFDDFIKEFNKFKAYCGYIEKNIPNLLHNVKESCDRFMEPEEFKEMYAELKKTKIMLDLGKIWV